MSAAKTMHFSMTGAEFTKLVRARMLDDAPAAAYRLASCLLGDDDAAQNTVLSIALRLCNGTAKMTGNESALEVVDDDSASAKKFRKHIKWLHAGRIRIGTKWYQPTAFVTDVGPHDAGSDPRAKHYCGTDELVLENASFPDPTFPSIRREVIFEQCGERPHWHDVPRGHQEALDEYLAAGRTLHERSHSKTYRDEPPPMQLRPQSEGVPGRGPSKYEGTFDKDVGLDVDDPRYEAAVAVREAEAKASRLRRVADLRALILKQAGDDLIELSWDTKMSAYDDPPVVQVAAGSTMIPRAPFMVWAFARLTYLKIQLPEWTTISPPGMKMMMDDANHTDWVIGGGFDPQDPELYGGRVYAKAAEDLRAQIQDEYDDRRRALEEAVTTLVVGPVATGPIVFGKPNKASPPGSIVVLPNLRASYLLAVKDAVAVITQEGGEVAHLAQIGRERGLPMVRKPDALESFTEHSIVEVNTETRTARVVRYRVIDPTDVEEDD